MKPMASFTAAGRHQFVVLRMNDSPLQPAAHLKSHPAVAVDQVSSRSKITTSIATLFQINRVRLLHTTHLGRWKSTADRPYEVEHVRHQFHPTGRCGKNQCCSTLWLRNQCNQLTAAAELNGLRANGDAPGDAATVCWFCRRPAGCRR